MATSAQRIRPMLSVASPGAAAIPMLALIRTLTPLRTNGCSSSAVSASGEAGGVRRIAVDEHGPELVAADADQHIGRAQRAHEPRSELLEQLIPGGVAEGVVDLLEMVQVDEQKRQTARRRRRIGKVVEVRVEHGRELAAVAEPGELVGHCLAVAFLGQRAQPAYRETQAQPDHDQGGCREGRRRSGPRRAGARPPAGSPGPRAPRHPEAGSPGACRPGAGRDDPAAPRPRSTSG